MSALHNYNSGNLNIKCQIKRAMLLTMLLLDADPQLETQLPVCRSHELCLSVYCASNTYHSARYFNILYITCPSQLYQFNEYKSMLLTIYMHTYIYLYAHMDGGEVSICCSANAVLTVPQHKLCNQSQVHSASFGRLT